MIYYFLVEDEADLEKHLRIGAQNFAVMHGKKVCKSLFKMKKQRIFDLCLLPRNKNDPNYWTKYFNFINKYKNFLDIIGGYWYKSYKPNSQDKKFLKLSTVLEANAYVSNVFAYLSKQKNLKLPKRCFIMDRRFVVPKYFGRKNIILVDAEFIHAEYERYIIQVPKEKYVLVFQDGYLLKRPLKEVKLCNKGELKISCKNLGISLKNIEKELFLFNMQQILGYANKYLMYTSSIGGVTFADEVIRPIAEKITEYNQTAEREEFLENTRVLCQLLNTMKRVGVSQDEVQESIAKVRADYSPKRKIDQIIGD